MAKTPRREPISVWPYAPGMSEWHDIPWKRGAAALDEAFGAVEGTVGYTSSGAPIDTSKPMFIGASPTRFYFQRYGVGCVGIAKDKADPEVLVFRA